MARYTKQSVTSLAGINSELTKIQTALADTLSRKDDVPNQMEGTFDANSNRIINLPEPVADHEAMPFGTAKAYTERAEAAAIAAEASELDAEAAAAIAIQYPEGQLAAALALDNSVVPVGGTEAGKLAKRNANTLALEEIDPTVGSGGDDTATFTAAFAAAKAGNKTVIADGSKTYNIAGKVTGDYCKFDGNGCTINTTPATAIEIWPTTAAAVTSLSSDFILANRNLITVTSSAGMARGQLISIATNDVFHPERTAYVRGITSKIEFISGNTIRLADAIPFTLTAAGSRVVTVEPVKFDFKNAVINGNDVTVNQIGIDIACSINPQLNDVHLDKFGVAAFVARHCVNVRINNSITGQSYFVGTNQSYGFLDLSCNGFTVDGVQTYTGRHGFATGASSFGLPGFDTISDTRGAPCLGVRILNSKIFPEVGISPASGGGDNGIDCHESTYDVTIENSYFNRFQLFSDYVTVKNCRVTGNTGEPSLLNFRPITNKGKILFEDVIWENMGRIELKGITASYTGDAHIPSIHFVRCESGSPSGMFFRPLLNLGAASGTNKIGEIVLDDTKLVFVNDLNNVIIQLDKFIMRNVRDNQRVHFSATGAITDFRVRLGVVQDCSLAAGFNSLAFALMQNVVWENIDWETTQANFSARVSDDANVYISNTRLNFGSTSISSLGITANGGGGKLFTVNSPYNIRTGDSTAGFATVTNL